MYKNKVKFVDDDEAMPDKNVGGIRIRIEKVKTFTLSKRKQYRISDKVKDISPTVCNSNNKQGYPPQFKGYFEQNFKKQFFGTARGIN